MNDEYIKRKSGTISVLEGKRSSVERRLQNERRSISNISMVTAKGTENRKEKRRVSSADRRIGSKMTGKECLIGRIGALSVSLLFAVIGTLFFITGITFLPYFGFIFGAMAFSGSFFFLFTRNKYDQGLLNKS